MSWKTKGLLSRVVCMLVCAAATLGLVTTTALAASGLGSVSATGAEKVPAADAVIDVEDWRDFTIDTSNGDSHFDVFKSTQTKWLANYAGSQWQGWDVLLIGNSSTGTSIFAEGNWTLSGKVTLTWPNGVLAYDGTRYDLVMEVSNVHGRWRNDPLCNSKRLMSLFWFSKSSIQFGGGEENVFNATNIGNSTGASPDLRGNVGKPGKSGAYAKLGYACDIKVYAKGDGAKLKYNLAFVDVDQPDFSSTASGSFNDTYTESVQLKGGNFDGATVYVNEGSSLKWNTATKWLWGGAAASGSTSTKRVEDDPAGFTVQTTLDSGNSLMLSAPGGAYTALFRDHSYELDATTMGDGTVTIKAGTTAVETSDNSAGSTIALETIPKRNYSVVATPSLGYHVGTLKLDGKDQDFTQDNAAKAVSVNKVAANHAVVASFTPWNLTVRYHANGGSIGNGVTGYRVGTDGLIERLSNNKWTDATTSANIAAVNDDGASTSKWTNHMDLYNGRGGTFKLTRTGYHLTATEEWNTRADGTGTAFNQDSTSASATNVSTGSKVAGTSSTSITKKNNVNYLTAAKTVDLYADWTPNALTIRYFANDATHDGGTALSGPNVLLKGPLPYVYDSDALAKNGLENANGGTWKLSKLGYHATNLWRVDSPSAAETVSADATYAKVQDLANAVGKSIDTGNNSVDLYAVLAPNTYNIAYDLDGGTLADWAPTKATYDESFEVPVPHKEGFVFDGWTISGMDSNRHVIGGEESYETNMGEVMGQMSYLNLHATQDATVTFTAQWHLKDATLKRVVITSGMSDEVKADLIARLEAASEEPFVDDNGNIHLKDMSVETGTTVTVGTIPTISSSGERTLPGGNKVSYDSGWVPDGWYLEDPSCSAENLVAPLDSSGRAAFWVPDDGRTEFTLYVQYDQKIVDGVTSAT